MLGQLKRQASRLNRAMVNLALLSFVATTAGTGLAPAPYAYSGEPILTSSMPYKLVSYSVSMNIDTNQRGRATGTVTVDSTMVFRSEGPAGTAALSIPVIQGGPSAAELDIKAAWDKRPLNLQTQPSKPMGAEMESDMSASVPLRAQGTHALRVHYTMPLQNVGYSGNEFQVSYLMNSNAPAGLFTFGIKYSPDSVFNLPTISPNLGWQIGRNGAAMRAVNFTPPNGPVTMQFYPNGFKQIGR
jgi:hypothetical protein